MRACDDARLHEVAGYWRESTMSDEGRLAPLSTMKGVIRFSR